MKKSVIFLMIFTSLFVTVVKPAPKESAFQADEKAQLELLKIIKACAQDNKSHEEGALFLESIKNCTNIKINKSPASESLKKKMDKARIKLLYLYLSTSIPENEDSQYQEAVKSFKHCVSRFDAKNIFASANSYNIIKKCFEGSMAQDEQWFTNFRVYILDRALRKLSA